MIVIKQLLLCIVIIMPNPSNSTRTTKKHFSAHLLFLLACLSLLNTAVAQQQQIPQTRGEDVQFWNDDKVSLTNRQRAIEQGELMEFYKNQTSVVRQEFAFEIANQFEQFHFHLAADHTVYFISRVFVLKNNAYIQVPNIDVEPAVHLVMYENNHRIIAQKSFHFQSIVKIQGKAGSTYMMRYYSPTPKLLVISHNNFVQISEFEGKIKSSKMQQNSLRIASIVNKLTQVFKNLRFTYRMELQEKKQFTNSTQSYSNYQILEMLMLLCVCLLQIKVVSRLFKTQSIV